MKVEIKDISATRKEMEVVVPKEDVNKVADEIYHDIAKNANVKGFRKGKAPRDIIRMYYGEYLTEEFTKKLVNEKFEQAVKDNDLFVVSMPEFDNDPPQEDQEFTFTAKFDIKPEIEVDKCSGYDFQKLKVEVSEDSIQDVFGRLQETYATIKDVEDSEYQAAADDYVVVDITCEENEKLSRQNMTVEAGKRSAFPGLDTAVVGMKKGEEKVVDIDFPEDHFIEEMRGKSAQVKITVNLIKCREIPELNDDFAKKVRQDVENMDDLNDAIREDLAERLEADSRASLEKQIVDKLIEENPFEIAQTMIQMQAAMMIQGLSQRLSAQGMKMQDIYPDPSALQEETLSSAERIVRQSLLMEAIAKKQNIEANDQDIDQEIEKMVKGSPFCQGESMSLKRSESGFTFVNINFECE